MKKFKNTLLGQARLVTYASLVVLTAFLILSPFGCSDPLVVENPNDLVEGDLSNPIGANGVANGALATVAEGVAAVLAPLLTATDEVTWIGSRDAWRELDFGNVSFDGNEFTDDAMKFLHEGRWMADKAVLQLSEFDAAGTLPDRIDLARSHLYAALARVYVADWFDDWAFSDKTEPAPAVGEDNMHTVYTDAIAILDKVIDIARSEGNTDIETRALALRARANHALAVWGLLNPKGSVPASPYVDAGRSDAEAALALMGDDTYRWQLMYAPGAEFNDASWQINGRLELGIVADANLSKPEFYRAIMDPIAGVEDPRVLANIAEFTDNARWNGTDYAPLTVVSAKEMRLIIAESDIARSAAGAAVAQMNTIRALDGLKAITTEDPAIMLQHERRANLHMQGRRLADMYRFGIQDATWQTTSDAFKVPGSFLPITISEKMSNPLIN